MEKTTYNTQAELVDYAAKIFADIFMMQLDSQPLSDVILPSVRVVEGKPAGSTTHTGGWNRHESFN